LINQQSPTSPAPSDLQFINTLAEGLGEKPFTSGYHQLHIAVQILGGRAVMQIAQRALAIHQGDGMLTLEGKKRTLGGCFFALFKAECTPEQLAQFYQQRRAGQQRDGHDQAVPATTATKPMVKPKQDQGNVRRAAHTPQPTKKPAPTAQLPQAKKPVAPVKAGQTEGKRKPMAPTGKHRKSGK
jgi:hypothetical protein